MARKLRVEYPGAIYHVLNRGDRREPIFKDDEDRRRFLVALGDPFRKVVKASLVLSGIRAGLDAVRFTRLSTSFWSDLVVVMRRH